MTMLERVKAMPLQSAPTSRYAFADPDGDGPDIPAFSLDQLEDYALRHREQIAKEADERIERLAQALRTIAAQHSGKVASNALADCMASIARVALAEARKP